MQWIIDILFYTLPAAEGVTMAMPAWLLPAAITAGSQLYNALSQRGEKKKANRRRDRLEGQQNMAMDEFKNAIQMLEGRAGDINEDASVDELYGDIIQSFTDRTQAGTDTGIRELFRTMMGAGGDVTGQGAANAASFRQGGNKSISDIVNRFTELTDRRNVQQQSRADNLYGTSLGNRGNLFSALSGLATDAQGKVDRRSTAGRQFFLDAIGTGAQLYGQLKSNQT